MADEGPALWGDAALRAFPDAFDERQRPKCGHWSEHFGPCICGDPKRHEERDDDHPAAAVLREAQKRLRQIRGEL